MLSFAVYLFYFTQYMKQTIIFAKGGHSLFLSRSKHLREYRVGIRCSFVFILPNEGSNDRRLWNYH